MKNHPKTTNLLLSRFFEDVETSMNSLSLPSKRDFVASLAEIDSEYDKIMNGLMEELNKKKLAIKTEI